MAVDSPLDRSRTREYPPGLLPEEQQSLNNTSDYGPEPQVTQPSAPAQHVPPEISSPPRPKRLKFENPPEAPVPDPGASSSGDTGPVLPISENTGPLLPTTDAEPAAEPAASSSASGPAPSTSQPEPGATSEKNDESDGNEGDRTPDYQV